MYRRLTLAVVLLFAFNAYAAETLDNELAQRIERDKKTYQAGIEITKVYPPENEIKYWNMFLEAQPDHIFAPNIKKRLDELKPKVVFVAASDGAPVVNLPGEQAKTRNTVNGFMLGASVGTTLGTTSVSGGVRYWSDYVGGDFMLGIEKGAADVASSDIIDTTSVGVGLGLLAGYPLGRIKPNLRVGFLFSYAKDSVARITLRDFEIAPSIGIDFRAAEHLLLGVSVLSFTFVVQGDAKNGSSVPFGGHDISFLNAVQVAYVF